MLKSMRSFRTPPPQVYWVAVGGGASAGARADTGSGLPDQIARYVLGIATKRKAGLGDDRLYFKLLRLGSMIWPH